MTPEEQELMEALCRRIQQESDLNVMHQLIVELNDFLAGKQASQLEPPKTRSSHQG